MTKIISSSRIGIDTKEIFVMDDGLGFNKSLEEINKDIDNYKRTLDELYPNEEFKFKETKEQYADSLLGLIRTNLINNKSSSEILEEVIHNLMEVLLTKETNL